MAITKTTSLTFRIAADRQYRFIANMIQVMIRDYCRRVHVAITEPCDVVDKTTTKPHE